MTASRIDRIVISFGVQRKHPKTGDRRTTKKYGLEIRIPVRVTFGPHTGAYVVSRGRQLFDWATPAEAFKLYPHLMTAEERAEARV